MVSAMRVLTLILWLIAVFGVSVHAQVYRWTDENGKVHFSDQAPPEQEVEDVTDSAKVVNIDASGSEQDKLGTIFAPETEEEKHLKQQRAAAARQLRDQQCAKVRHTLRIMTEGRFHGVDEKGETFEVSKDEARQKREELQTYIARHCSP